MSHVRGDVTGVGREGRGAAGLGSTVHTSSIGRRRGAPWATGVQVCSGGHKRPQTEEKITLKICVEYYSSLFVDYTYIHVYIFAQAGNPSRVSLTSTNTQPGCAYLCVNLADD